MAMNDGGGRPHDGVHLVCEDCGAIEEAEAVMAAQLSGRVESAYGFVARATKVTVFGRCAHCLTGQDSGL